MLVVGFILIAIGALSITVGIVDWLVYREEGRQRREDLKTDFYFQNDDEIWK